jgi:hypothetical protein
VSSRGAKREVYSASEPPALTRSFAHLGSEEIVTHVSVMGDIRRSMVKERRIWGLLAPAEQAKRSLVETVAVLRGISARSNSSQVPEYRSLPTLKMRAAGGSRSPGHR